VMTRALQLVTAYAFERRGVDRLELYTLLENRRSQAVAERAGFVREGIERGRIESRDGRRRDAYVFAATPPAGGRAAARAAGA
jgi:RimJ/RimL family protein N-acetyltransferase